MKKIFYELRLCIIVFLVGIAVNICPKEAKKTLVWFAQIPFEE